MICLKIILSAQRLMYNKELCSELLNLHTNARACMSIYLSPFTRAPLDRAIPDIAVSSVGGRWLRAHVIWNGHRLSIAACHFVNTGDITRLYTDTARAHAS